MNWSFIGFVLLSEYHSERMPERRKEKGMPMDESSAAFDTDNTCSRPRKDNVEQPSAAKPNDIFGFSKESNLIRQ